ncbi:MAG: hypothetical protein HFH66_10300 [Lachnospiraceae bacterium]|nr:hypothetical protein [Lachnospiraceae bacterium]
MFHVLHSVCQSQDLQQHRRLLTTRGIRQPHIYFCTLTVSREDVRAFMAERPEYTKANRFKDIVVKVYI